jgi:hypothetical protein
MSRGLPIVCTLALLIAQAATPLVAQEPETATLRIRVTDAADGQVIAGAIVGFPALEHFGLTNTAGDALLTGIRPGDHVLQVTMFGYGDATALLHLEPGAVATGSVELTFAPIEIAGITVEGRSLWSAYLDRRGFYQRDRMGWGRHVDRTEIERLGIFVPSDLVQRTLGMQQAALGSFLYSGAGCQPKVYVDGVIWSGSVDDVPINWIEGIELYPRSTGAPVEYAGFGGGPKCGLILIWLG